MKNTQLDLFPEDLEIISLREENRKLKAEVERLKSELELRTQIEDILKKKEDILRKPQHPKDRYPTDPWREYPIHPWDKVGDKPYYNPLPFTPSTPVTPFTPGTPGWPYLSPPFTVGDFPPAVYPGLNIRYGGHSSESE